MRFRDYIALGWDQLRRRKVVTLLCVMGIAIGSASIVVALAFGESVAHYSARQMNYYLKTDEITVINGGSPGTGQTDAADDYSMTPQKLKLLKTLPHVKTAAGYDLVGDMDFTVDDTKTGRLQVIATELDTLADFGQEFQQGAPIDQDHTIVLSYSATVDLRDKLTAQKEAARIKQARGVPGAMGERENDSPLVSYPLYRKQIRLAWQIAQPDGSVRTLEFPVRVAAIEKRPDNASDTMIRFSPKTAYISMGLARQIHEAVAAASRGTAGYDGPDRLDSVKVKVDSADAVAGTDKLIQSLKLRTINNLQQQERMNGEFVILRIVFGGAGLFILFVASISIVVAMTMSTHQRRRQIGIMKVLGANLKQIRNMFVFESAMLGLFGGLAGILFAYWVIWGINIIVINVSGTRPGQSPEVLFISLWIVPVGLFFALLTGVLSGIFPAVKASRTDALSAIKRE